MVTKFVLNTVLQHVGLSWIIETNQKLEYYIYKHNPDWLTNSTWYNTSICTKLHRTVFENKLEMQELTDIFLQVLLIKTRKKAIIC